MSMHENPVVLEELDEKSVSDYLRANPEFFTKQTSLLATLKVPHPVGQAVSLIEYQVKILRERNQKLTDKLKEMISSARTNEKLHDRIILLSCALIRGGSLDELLRSVEQCLVKDFKVDQVAFRLFEARTQKLPRLASLVHRSDSALAPFESFLKVSRPFAGQLKPTQLEFLFASGAHQIQSSALIPLGRKAEFGFLALGSRDRRRFNPGKDSAFLNQISQLISHALLNRL